VNNLGSGLFIVRIKTADTVMTGNYLRNNSTSNTTGLNCSLSRQSLFKNNSKTSGEIIPMQYNDGDVFHFRGISGDFLTISALIPISNESDIFHFVAATDEDGSNYTTPLGPQTWMI
jgi:hypothetical protein